MEKKINFSGEFFYVITGSSVLILRSTEGDEIIKSRKVQEVAQKIIEDPDILTAYEEKMIDVHDSLIKEDLDQAIKNLKLKETFQFSDES